MKYLILALALVSCSRATKPETPKKEVVEAWSRVRYHFVKMVSDTDEVYTMICDRHTGIESLLAKSYNKPDCNPAYEMNYGRESRGCKVVAMTYLPMGFNEDCLGRDVLKYQHRGRRGL